MKWLGGVLVAIVVVIGLMTVLGRGPAVPALGLGAPTTDGAQSGYAADQARLVQTGDDGAPQYLLEAERLRQDSASEEIFAETLQLNYVPPEDQNADSPSWTLTANEGRMAPGEQRRFSLSGKVRLAGQPEGAREPVRLETSSLDFDLDRQVATTREAVSFYSGSRRLTARGLNADLKQGTLRLDSSVHGRFPP